MRLSEHPTTAEVHRALSEPVTTAIGFDRRRFLIGALAAAAAGTVVPGWLAEAAHAAPPLAPGERILVAVLLGGGNDGLNTVVPLGNAPYAAARPTLRVDDAQALPVGDGYGLHPALPTVKSLWDSGRAAIVHGVGTPAADLSHFNSMAMWMSGTTSPRGTGWLGRYLDGLDGGSPDLLRGVNLGSSLPLHLRGTRDGSATLPTDFQHVFGARRPADDPNREEPLYAVLRDLGARDHGTALANAFARLGRSTVDLGPRLAGVYGTLPDERFARSMTACARLINADLGVRVLTVTLGDFDTHAGQSWRHPDLLARLDTGLASLFGALDPSWRSRVAVMTFSEFGRRVGENASGGTDHGTTGPMLVLGDPVKGGHYGEHPSLTALDASGNPQMRVDYRSVYATILGGLLDGDPQAVLGGTFEDLGFVLPAGSPPAPPPTQPTPAPPPAPPPTTAPAPTVPRGDAAWVAALYLDLLGRALGADEQRFWVDRIAAGMPRIEVAITLARSPEWTRVVVADLYRAILGRDPDAGGLEHWSGRLRNGERVAGLAGMIYGSPEYYANAGGTPEGWVRALYRSVLLREPDAAGTAYWASQVRSGVPLANLAQGIYLSVESNARRVDALYAKLLGRGTDPAGREFWAQYLVDQDDIVLASQLVASDEYHARAQGR